MTLAHAARWYGQKRWSIFPLAPRNKIPLGGHGVKDATIDTATIKTWWDEKPDANIGLAMGERSGLLAVDVDGEAGAATLADLERQHGLLPPTIEQATARGRHLLFKLPAGVEIRNSAGKIGYGIDVRGSGGYIVVAPSVHPSGTPYQWKAGRKPNEIEPADLPDWLLALIVKPEPQPRSTNGAGAASDARMSNYARAALADELANVASAPEGQRNDQLNRSAFSLGTLIGAGMIDRGVVERALVGAAAAAGLDSREATATIKSGIDAGIQHPREIPEQQQTGNGATDNLSSPSPAEAAWPELAADAFHGLAGEIVRMIDPHTEADQAAILVQFLVAFGNAVGRGPHFVAEADRHGTNMYAVFVGETAKGRKGTSWGQARRVVEMADESWPGRIASGLSSGEGLIWQVRDAIQKREAIKKNGRVVDYETVVTDEGVTDKRLLTFEGEFASVLRVLEREGNTLSPVARNAWDNGDLRTLTKNSSAVATGTHISIVAHITRHELLRYLESTEAGNGFANRFLWCCVKRSKLLPEGGALEVSDLVPLAQTVKDALEFARHVSEVRRDEEARAIWRQVYPALSEDKPGLLGAVTARAEAQTMRLALIYAMLDRSPVIRAEHLRAALAVWEYAEASAEFIFGDRLGDPEADTILAALRRSPGGLTRTEIRDLFGRHRSGDRIDAALAALMHAGRVRMDKVGTRGRPAECWFATVL